MRFSSLFNVNGGVLESCEAEDLFNFFAKAPPTICQQSYLKTRQETVTLQRLRYIVNAKQTLPCPAVTQHLKHLLIMELD
jgi:hypothetical protein